MSIAQSVGSLVGKTGAYAFEGTRLVSSQFALGVAEGYVQKSEQLRARRLALASETALEVPALPSQRKVKVQPA